MDETLSVRLDVTELHTLVTWAYAIKSLDGEAFSEEEQCLLDKLKALRSERLVLR